MVARKYFRIGVGAAGVTTIVGLFLLLVNLYGFNIVGTDDVCVGTKSDPCISYINVTNPNLYNVDIYNPNEIQLKFSPEIPEYYLFRKDGRCRGGPSCAAPNGVSISGWNYIDFTNKTKPVATAAYVYRFPARETKEFLLWGLKEHPSQKIKWTLDAKGTVLDPIWEGTAFKSTRRIFEDGKEKELQSYYFKNNTCKYYSKNDTFVSCIEEINRTTVPLSWDSNLKRLVYDSVEKVERFK